MKKLQHEVTEVAQGRHIIAEEDLEKMHYLKAVIKESLRLHMPAPLLLPQISTQDVKLMGYDIPARTQVIVNAWAIGRDPMLWEEAEEFRPQRFLKNKIDYKGLHFEWLPFDAGRRTCPGIQFGVAIMELAVANIVYKFDVGLPNGVKHEDLDMSEKYGVLLHKKSPLVVTTTARF
ncbi:putative cytochrome P450 [Helianthus annuus]|nr:putative cytochrome P450 [Helianthus annuus]